MATSAVDISIVGQLTGTSGGWVRIKIDKALCVFTLDEFKTSLRRGKRWLRRQAFEARHAPEDKV
jgi:hypothetical protein